MDGAPSHIALVEHAHYPFAMGPFAPSDDRDERDVISIDGLMVDCVVGVYPHERNASQPLSVDLALGLDTRLAARTERVAKTVDYAFLSAQVVFLLRSCRFRLLETAADALARHILVPPGEAERRAPVDRVRVRLTKPGALRGFAQPSLEIVRYAARSRPVERQPVEWGRIDTIYETRDAGIYRYAIAPHASIPLHRHERTSQAEMVLTKGLLCQREKCSPGAVHRWPRGASHCYDNPTDRWQCLLSVEQPRHDPEDTLASEGEPSAVSPEAPWAVAG